MRARLALLLAVAPPPLAAADLDLPSRIEQVTVFPDAALVTRVGRIDLPAGASALLLRDLPPSLDPASVRVEGQGAFAIGAVDVRLTPGEARPAVDAALEARLTRLRDERDGVGARLAALEGKKAAIERYAQASPEKLGVEGRPFEVAQWQNAWEAIGAGLSAVHEELRQARAKSRDLEAEIAALERARPTPPRPGAPRREVTVAVEAAAAGSGEVRLTYRVSGASWTPVYDARLDTGSADRKPALDLTRRAQVTQRTGEDWADVDLSVSTLRVNRGAAAPDLLPLQVSFYEPFSFSGGQGPRRPAPSAAPPAVALRDGGTSDTEKRQREAAEPAPEQVAAVEASAFQATFRVPGRIGLPPDGSAKTFALGQRRAEPLLTVTAAPELDGTAFLQASFPHEEDAPLLPGEVFLHRDGSFVGRARLKLAAAGETVDLGFGADDRVKVTRVPLRRRENEPGWIGQTKTDLREFKTIVRNGHARPMRITVADRLPFSENTAITVEQLRDTTPPTEKGPGDKRGVLHWTYDYAPAEQKEIRLGYRLRWPADRDVVFEPKPVANGTPRS